MQEPKLQLHGLVTSRPQSPHHAVQRSDYIYGTYAAGGKLLFFVTCVEII
jgi:hypothetical protein